MPYSESGSMSGERPEDFVFTKENPFVDTKKPSELKNAPIRQRNSVNLSGNLEKMKAKDLNTVDLFPSMRGVKLPGETYSGKIAKGAEEEAEDEARFLEATTPHDPSENEPEPDHGTRTVQTPPPLELFYENNPPQQEDRA